MVLLFLKNIIEQRGAKLASFLLTLLSVFVITALYFNQNQFIGHTVFDTLVDTGLIVTLGLLTFYLIARKGFYIALPVSVLFSAIYVWIAYLLIGDGNWIRIIYPLLAVIFTLLIGVYCRYLVQLRSGGESHPLFSGYHWDKGLAHLEEALEVDRIGGDNKDVTVIFTDIKDFTAFAEKHTPREVVKRLNEYLSVMVQVIEEYDGYVDKFIGDGIMAYWGAPRAQPNHAELAIACLLAMNKSMEDLCVKWHAEGVEPFAIRAGVQSGEVVAGNIGLRGKKMEYTVIGDIVNQAARLESSAKYYGVATLAGENTYLSTRDVFNYRELDKVRMAGKQVPVTVYELIGPKTAGINKLNEAFAAALATYRACHWEEAENRFAAIVAEFPGDGPSVMYLERCQYFKGAGVNKDWDGVFNRRGK